MSRSKRQGGGAYAPRSEKLKDRLLNEAEQAAAEGEETDDADTAAIPDTGLEDAEKPEPKKRGRKPLPEDLPRERVEHDLAEEEKVCPCCRNRLHRMGESVSEQLPERSISINPSQKSR